MKNKQLIKIVQEFRDGLLGDQKPKDMCFIVCFPLQGYLSACEGVDASLLEVWYGGVHHHYVLRLADGTVIDPTYDQFAVPGDRLPPVYAGPLPEFYSLTRLLPMNHESLVTTRKRLCTEALLRRDGAQVDGKLVYPCCWCGRHLAVEHVTIEHVLPKSKGGTNDLSNLKIACRQCNSTRLCWESTGVQPKYDNVAQRYVVPPPSRTRRTELQNYLPQIVAPVVPVKPLGAKRDKGKWNRMLSEGTARYRKQMGWDRPAGS